MIMDGRTDRFLIFLSGKESGADLSRLGGRLARATLQ